MPKACGRHCGRRSPIPRCCRGSTARRRPTRAAGRRGCLGGGWWLGGASPDSAPQTNEVGRSAVLMSGLLVLAETFPQPVELLELGASAGLNLVLDRYGYELGGVGAGDPASELQLKPEWKGPQPPGAAVKVA